MLLDATAICEIEALNSPARCPSDPWWGLSDDLIGRFLDVISIEYRITRRVRARYRSELGKLDRWMQQTMQRTLVSATRRDLECYLVEYLAGGASPDALAPALERIRRFYAFALALRCRDDDPTEGLALTPDPSLSHRRAAARASRGG